MTGPPWSSAFKILSRTVQFTAPCVGVFVGSAGQAQDLPVISELEMSFTQLRVNSFILESDLSTHDDHGSVCVDLRQFVRAIEAPIKVDTTSGTASGWYLSEARVFDLNLATHKLTTDGVLSTVGEKDVRMTELGPCVTLDALQKWFPINFGLNKRESSLMLEPREPLPILARLQREDARKKIADYRQSSADPMDDAPDIAYALWSIPSFDLSVSSSLAKSKNQPLNRNVTYTLSAVGELAHMTAEGLLQSGSDGLPRSLRARLVRNDPKGNGLFNGSGITQFSLGDVTSIGNAFIGGGAVGRGVSISTFPLTQSDEFDRTSLRGDLPDGWEAELYRNDSLISYQPPSANGRYEFADVPVFFGQNRFRVVLYGPQGQRRDIDRNIDTGQIITPRGDWYTRFSALQKNIDTIALTRSTDTDPDNGSWRYDAEARTGILSNASLGIGGSSYTKSGERLWFGSLSLQTSVARTIVELEGVKDKGSGWGAQTTLSRSFGDVGVRLRYARYGGGFESERVDPSSHSRLDGSIAAPVRFAHNFVVPMSLRGVYTKSRVGANLYGVNWSATTNLRGTSLSSSLNYAGNGTTEVLNGGFGLNRRFNDTTLRAQAEYNLRPTAEFAGARIGFDKGGRFDGGGWHYGADAAWSNLQKQADFTANVTRRFGAFSLSAQSSVSTSGAFGVGLSFTTSFGREPIYNRWRLSARSLSNGGNMALRVFEDMDGDDRFGPEDRPIAGAKIQRSGSGEGVSSSDGVLLVDSLTPYQPVKLNIDLDSLPDADLTQSLSANTTVIPRQGATGKLDIPLVMAGGIEGEISLMQVNETNAVPGLTVEMLNAAGDVIATTHSEFDGFFFFERVPLGSYRLRVAPSQAKALGLSGNALQDVAISRDKPYPATVKLALFKTGQAPTVVASLELKPLWGDREVMTDKPWIALAAVWDEKPNLPALAAIEAGPSPRLEFTAVWEELPMVSAPVILQRPVIIGRSDAQTVALPAPTRDRVIPVATAEPVQKSVQVSAVKRAKTPVRRINYKRKATARALLASKAPGKLRRLAKAHSLPAHLALEPQWNEQLTPEFPAMAPAALFREEIAVRRIYFGKSKV
jgi:hypothetical protein